MTVSCVAYADPASNSVESDSGTVDILEIRPPPYTAPENTAPEKKKKL